MRIDKAVFLSLLHLALFGSTAWAQPLSIDLSALTGLEFNPDRAKSHKSSRWGSASQEQFRLFISSHVTEPNTYVTKKERYLVSVELTNGMVSFIKEVNADTGETNLTFFKQNLLGLLTKKTRFINTTLYLPAGEKQALYRGSSVEVTTCTYDDYGQLIEERFKSGVPAESTTEDTYDFSVERRKTYEYNEDGLIMGYTLDYPELPGLGEKTAVYADSANARFLKIEEFESKNPFFSSDADTLTFMNRYDRRGRIVERTEYRNGVKVKTTRYRNIAGISVPKEIKYFMEGQFAKIERFSYQNG